MDTYKSAHNFYEHKAWSIMIEIHKLQKAGALLLALVAMMVIKKNVFQRGDKWLQ